MSRRTAAALLWSFAGSGFQTLAKLAVLMILARLLLPEEFGRIATAAMIATFLSGIAKLGVAPAIVQHQHLSRMHLQAGFNVAALLGIGIGAVLYISADMFGQFFAMEGVPSLIRILAAVPVLAGFSQVSEAILQRDLRFRDLTIIETLSYTFGYGGVGVTLALLGLGAEALAIGMVASTIISTIAQLRLVPPALNLRVSFTPYAEITKFGVGLSAAQLSQSLAYNADNFVVAKWLGAEAVGLYSRAFQVLTMPTKLFGKGLLGVLFPSFSAVQSEPERAARALVRSLGFTAFVSFSSTAVLVVMAPEIVAIILGNQWGAVVGPFQLLAFAIFARLGHKVCDAMIRAKGAVYGLAWRQMVYAASVFAGAYVGHHFGLSGAAAGVTLAIYVNFIIMLTFSVHLSAAGPAAIVAPAIRHLLIALAAGSVAWLAASELREYGMPALVTLIAGVATSALFYAGLLRFASSVLGDDMAYFVNTLRLLRKKAPKKLGSSAAEREEKQE